MEDQIKSGIMETVKNNKTKFLFPLTVGIDPMERLIIGSFKGDPEFEMLEPQVFNDPVNGKGMRVLRYRKDNKIDVYWQKGVNVDPAAISIGSGICDFAETEINPAVFEFSDTGVYVDVAFKDLKGRKVELKIKENTNINKRMTFLAPVGNDIEKPKRLFLVNMFGFDFVKKKGTEVFAKIGSNKLTPQGFPILRNLKSVFFIRYSSNPVTGTLNPEGSVPVEFETDVPGSVTINDMKIVINNEGRISEISSGQNDKTAEVSFFPAYPNLYNMNDGDAQKGRWIYRIGGIIITGGVYNVNKSNNKFNLEIDVTDIWKPEGLPFSFKVFTYIASFFRKWPATYRWRGIITVTNTVVMTGKWERKKK